MTSAPMGRSLWLAAWFVLCISTAAHADFKLEPDHIPLPTYGKEGETLTFDIKVRLKYTIHNDGSISDVSLLDTNHPEYAESVLKAVTSWRYKPWPLDGNPPTAVLISTFIKTMDPDLNETHREILRNMRCRHLSKEVARFQDASPEESLIEMRTARRTRKMLNISPLELPYQQSLELAVLFEGWFLETVETCRDNPNERYLEYLPDALKQWM
jgi:periplasmic protein TonB